MNEVWKLQEAKNRLSELVQRAKSDGPQTITVRGMPTAIVLSMEEYDRLTHPQTTLTEFFRTSPLVGIDLEDTRMTDLPREIDL